MTDIPKQVAIVVDESPSPQDSSASIVACPRCTLEASPDDKVCKLCNYPVRPGCTGRAGNGAGHSPTPLSSTCPAGKAGCHEASPEHWSCRHCTLHNALARTTCEACGHPREANGAPSLH